MEQKVISLNKGIRRNPTTPSDGELTDCMNLRIMGGEVVNAPAMEKLETRIPEGYRLLYIHKTSTDTNYILYKDDRVTVMCEGAEGIVMREPTKEEKAKLYLQYVSESDNKVRNTEDYIKLKRAEKERIEAGGNASAAEQKLSEFSDLLEANGEDDIDLPGLLTKYDEMYNAEEKERFDGMTDMQRYEFISQSGGLFDRLGNALTRDMRIELYRPEGPHYRMSTTNKGYHLVYRFDPQAWLVDFTKVYLKIDENHGVIFDFRDNPKTPSACLGNGEEEMKDEEDKIITQTCTYAIAGYREYINIGTRINKALDLIEPYHEYYETVKYTGGTEAERQRRIKELEDDINENEEKLTGYKAEMAEAVRQYEHELSLLASGYYICQAKTVNKVTSIGDILIICADSSLIRAIYKGEGRYAVDTDIPMLDMQLRLKSEFVVKTENEVLEFSKDDVIMEDYNHIKTDYVNVSSFEVTEQFYRKFFYERYIGSYDSKTWTFHKTEILTLGQRLTKGQSLKLDIRKTGTSMIRGMHVYLMDDSERSIVYKVVSKTSDGIWSTVIDIEDDAIYSKLMFVYAGKFQDHGETNYVVRYSESVAEAHIGYKVKNDIDNYTAAIGNVNNFLSKEGVLKDRFIHPFFARVGYRMSDGSLLYPSAPVLMLPNVGRVPVCIASSFRGDGDTNVDNRQDMTMCAFASNLEYRLRNTESEMKALSEMSDMIKSVFIAVSNPIYKFNQGAAFDEKKRMIAVSEWNRWDSIDNDYSVSSLTNDTTRKTPIFTEVAQRIASLTGIKDKYYVYDLPEFDDAEVRKNVINANAFHLIKEIPIEDLITDTFTPVYLEKGTLKGLTGRELVEDDTSSLNKYIPSNAIAYNNRLVLGAVREYKFDGYNPSATTGYCNSLYIEQKKAYSSELERDYDCNYVIRYGAVVSVRSGGEVKKVYKLISADNMKSDGNTLLNWFYYPSSNAISATIYRRRVGKVLDVAANGAVVVRYVDELTRGTVNLTEHPDMDGAFWFDNFNSIALGEFVNLSSPDDEAMVIMRITEAADNSFVRAAQIMQTKVNNPFVIDVSSVNNVGNGEIHAITVNTQALSQGQFGQHPLLVFTSDGVWPLSVADDGKLSAPQPPTRDVIIKGTLPCQADSMVFYACNDGVKMIAGSNTTCVSQTLDGRIGYEGICLPDTWSEVIKEDVVRFNDALPNCKMLFDSDNGLLHVFSSAFSSYHYILELNSKEWSKMSGGMPDSIVEGFPYTVMQIGNELCRYRHIRSDETKTGYLLTREISFDNPLALKMLRWVRIMRDRCGDGATVKGVIYVSNDRMNWTVLKSLKSKSWKWYRFAILCEMTDTDAIEGIVCGYEERWTDKAR